MALPFWRYFDLDPSGPDMHHTFRNTVAQYATRCRLGGWKIIRLSRMTEGGREMEKALRHPTRDGPLSNPGRGQRRLIVGISGASGIAYGVTALRILRRLGIETHLVMTRSAVMTLAHELPLKAKQVHELASVVHHVDNVGATIASGSFPTMGMLVAPCSIHSLSEIAYGNTSTLLTRAADVVLKERRRLVLMVRETPLHLGHLRAMTQATEAGAIIMPPVPALYAKPSGIDELVEHSVGRALDLFAIDNDAVRRWGEDVGPGSDLRATDVEGAGP
jgi:4-hydroxy-3-polyprenylbenzoate decarboxylase